MGPTAQVTFEGQGGATSTRARAPSLVVFGTWVAAWSAVGVVVGAAITLSIEGADLAPVMRLSVPFAVVVGLTALLSARIVFPSLLRFPGAVRLGLQVLTLISGAVVGSLAVLSLSPLFALARPRAVVWLISVNALLAVAVGLVLFAYETLRRQVEASFEELRRRENLARDFAIARDVQRQLLPREPPRTRGLEIAGVCRPAVGVGGDLFDFLPGGPDRLGIVIADVAGKGLPAALLMAGLQTGVRSVADPSAPPSRILERLNRLVAGTAPAARYATAFFAWWDGASRTLAYANAGHFPPFAIRDAGRIRLTAGGRPVGLFEDSTYDESRLVLAPGDQVVLYTDGVVEAPSADGEEFGEERLAESVARHASRTADEAVARVLEDVARWTGDRPPHDDVTLVLARVR